MWAKKSLKIYQRDNQKAYIKEKTIQWSKEKGTKGQTTI